MDMTWTNYHMWGMKVKGIFCDSNKFILWYESEDKYINKKSLFQKFQLIPILHLQGMIMCVSLLQKRLRHVELIIVDDNFC